MSIYPVLSSGHFNLSRQNYSHVVSKSKLILVGFSAHGCFSCREMEFNYKNISDKLLEMNVPFARADGNALGSIALAVEAKTMPALVLYKNNRPTLFKVMRGDSNGLWMCFIIFACMYLILSRVHTMRTWWHCSFKSNLTSQQNFLKQWMR